MKPTPTSQDWRDVLTVNLMRSASSRSLTKSQIRELIDAAVDGRRPDESLFTPLALESSQVKTAAQIWDEAYLAGVNDERTSEASIGIAGFGMKVEPARENPYRTRGQTASLTTEALLPVVRSEREAFEARVEKEAGSGAKARWLGTEAYENHRVQDNRLGWAWCLEYITAVLSAPKDEPEETKRG